MSFRFRTRVANMPFGRVVITGLRVLARRTLLVCKGVLNWITALVSYSVVPNGPFRYVVLVFIDIGLLFRATSTL